MQRVPVADNSLTAILSSWLVLTRLSESVYVN